MSPRAGSPGARLRLEGVVVTAGGRRLLDVPRLEVAENQTVVVVGENGSGKTTLVRVLGLLQPPSAGSVLVDGVPIGGSRTRRKQRRRILTQLQQTVLLGGTVRRNVALPVRLRGERDSLAERRADHWMTRFGVDHLADRHVASLSGGEARRTALARAFAADTEILLLDEPSAGLDAPFRRQLTGMIRRALRESPKTAVIVTHDMAEAWTLADQVVVLAGGRVQQIAPPLELAARPVNPAVARLVGLDTLLPGRSETAEGQGWVVVGPVRLAVGRAVVPGADVHVAIRPEDVALRAGEELPLTAAQNCLPARVTALEPQGPLTVVRLDAGFPLSATVLPSTARELDLAEGKPVWATIEASAVRVL